MFSEGAVALWLSTVAAHIQDGGQSPPSLSRLYLTVPPAILTRESDGHCTAAAAFGEDRRKDKEAGWRVIIGEMVTILREQGFVGGSDEGLTWIKPADGTWRVSLPNGSQPTIFGQRERRMDRDRSMVGERSEADGSRVGMPSKFESGRMHPLELQVTGPRGGITTQHFELHPLALAIPPMTEGEREMLRASIERDGVKMPIVIYQKKILDGRNRAYFAWRFKKPVHITVFEGTEEEARRHVVILNIHRRHLNGVQLAHMAQEFYGAQAAKMATESYRENVGRPTNSAPKSGQDSGTISEPKRKVRQADIVVKLAKDAGIVTTRPAVEGVRELMAMGAPETVARAKAGEFSKLPQAFAAAAAELGKEPPAVVPTMQPKTVSNLLGNVIEHLSRILRDGKIQAGKAQQPPFEISGRIQRARELLTDVEKALRDRKVIP